MAFINLLAPIPPKRRKSSQAEARVDQEIFFPHFYSIMAKAKTLLLSCKKKDTHFF